MKCREIMSTFTNKRYIDENREESHHSSILSKSINDDRIDEEDEEEKDSSPAERRRNNDIVIASDRNMQADYYIRGNPVSLYCTNVAVLMGGRINMWRSGRNSSGITDKAGNPISRAVFDNAVAYNDGKLEFTTFSTLLNVMLSKTKRLAQGEGPFEFKFKEHENSVTYVNIDGEFYQVHNIRAITIEKASKFMAKGCLRILVNE